MLRPLLRLLRVWLIVPAFWFAFYMIILYLALPSVTTSDLESNARFAFRQNFQHGISRFVTRVYDSELYFPSPGIGTEPTQAAQTRLLYDRRFSIFDFAVDNGAIVVHTPMSDQYFDCPAYDKDWTGLGDVKSVYITVGDADGVSPPWFSNADAALLFADSRVFVNEVSMTIATLQAQCQFRAQQEELKSWQNTSEWSYSISLLPATTVPRRSTPPLITVAFAADKQVVWVDFGKRQVDSNGHASVGTPSHTYPLRKMILNILGPTLIAIDRMHVTDHFEGSLDFLPQTYLGHVFGFSIYALIILVLFRSRSRLIRLHQSFKQWGALQKEQYLPEHRQHTDADGTAINPRGTNGRDNGHPPAQEISENKMQYIDAAS